MTKNNHVVSVVMPLYNAGKYIRESIESLINQSFQDFELICVNDGSIDDTLKIIEEYERKDNRIKILSNEKNEGAAFCRNRGIEFARGEYICFLDGDDYFEKDLIKKCYSTAHTNMADVVIFNYAHFSSDEIYQTRYLNRKKEYYDKYARHVFSFRHDGDPGLVPELTATCNKIYRRSFILNNGLRFQNIPRQNDVCFSLLAIFVSERSIVLDDDRAMVHARDHDESTRITNNKNPFCIYYAILELLVGLSDRRILIDVAPYYHMFFGIIVSGMHDTQSPNKTKQLEYYEFLRDKGINQINDIININGGIIDDLSKAIRLSFSLSYKTEWWELEEDEWISFILRTYKKRVIGLINNGYDLCAWGIGKNGKAFIDFCVENNIRVDVIIDKNSELWGKEYSNVTIEKPDILKRKNKPMIVITSNKISADRIAMEKNGYYVTTVFTLICEAMCTNSD